MWPRRTGARRPSRGRLFDSAEAGMVRVEKTRRSLGVRDGYYADTGNYLREKPRQVETTEEKTL